jgi:RNA polymerase sigma-70 factor (ECF subfamily)
MTERDWLAARFEDHRGHLRSVAYRMLGSMAEADDAVQEAWLRLSRSDADAIDNLGGWLTTVVARICLNMLRARRTTPGGAEERGSVDPEQEAELADSVGLALLVVLDLLDPAERLAFVLHDVFGVPFAEIAPVVDRTPQATRQLASRARRRVHGGRVPSPDVQRQRVVVDAFLAATRAGDFDALLEVLDPEITLRFDGPAGGHVIRGARAVAEAQLAHRARTARVVLVDGVVGIVVAPLGRLSLVIRPTIRDGRIVDAEVIADPEHLRALDLTTVD